MATKKKQEIKVTITRNPETKADMVIGRAGVITFNRNMTVFVDESQIDEGSKKIVKLLLMKIAKGNLNVSDK